MMGGVTLEDPIEKCKNSSFVSASKDSSRENILKLLDKEIKFIPILDSKGQLSSIATKDNMPLTKENKIYVRSRAPVRISFGGGGSDLTHYFSENPGAVINTAISVYCHSSMHVRNDYNINIHSLDLNKSLHAKDLDEALVAKDKSFD